MTTYDQPPGPGFWRASDGNWYPPQPSPPVPPYGYPAPYGAPAKTTVNGMAIASMVLGIVWVYWVGSLLALIFGLIARKQIRESQSQQSGSGFATAGIVLGLVGLGILALVLVVALIASLGNSNSSGAIGAFVH